MNEFVPVILLINCQGFENHSIVSEIRRKMETKLASEGFRVSCASDNCTFVRFETVIVEHFRGGRPGRP